MTETHTPQQITFAKHLEANPEDLEVCRKYCAKMDADAMRDDPDIEALFDMFYNGIGAAKDMLPLDVAEFLVDEFTEDQTPEQRMAEIREAMGE